MSEMSEEDRKQWKTGIQLFNGHPKKARNAFTVYSRPMQGVAHLINSKLIPNTPQEIAKFLMTCEELGKKHIGDYLGEEENIPVLEQFVALMDFRGLEFDIALRSLIIFENLPGPDVSW